MQLDKIEITINLATSAIKLNIKQLMLNWPNVLKMIWKIINEGVRILVIVSFPLAQ